MKNFKQFINEKQSNYSYLFKEQLTEIIKELEKILKEKTFKEDYYYSPGFMNDYKNQEQL